MRVTATGLRGPIACNESAQVVRHGPTQRTRHGREKGRTMKAPDNMTAVINRKRYSTATATLLAGNDWWDGHNWERSGRQRYLYRTPKGALFFVNLTQWQGEASNIEPADEDEALEFFETCARRETNRLDFDAAFPKVVIEEA